jgi:hypothetical protein
MFFIPKSMYHRLPGILILISTHPNRQGSIPALYTFITGGGGVNENSTSLIFSAL